MKAKVKKFIRKEDYRENTNPTEEIVFDSVTEALAMCKKHILGNRGSEKFLGFRIDKLPGGTIHKLNNNF